MRYHFGVSEDVGGKVEKAMFGWFGHIGRVYQRRQTKQIYMASVDRIIGKSGPRKTYLDQIGELIRKCPVKSSRN